MAKELIRPEQFCTVKTKASIDQSQLQLSEDLQKELDTLYKGAVETFQLGKLIMGTVVAVEDNGVLVDIKYKSRGLVPRYEFGEYELKKLHSGDAIEVILDQLEDTDGRIVLSYEKAKEMRAWDEVTKLFEKGEPAEGVVTHKVKGGLNVDIGIPAFLPGSQVDVQRVTNFDQYVGQTIVANIIKVNKKRGNLIISRRKFLGDQKSEGRKKVFDTITESSIITGIVKNITNYGVFIDIGGVDGLLHITDMTWGRIAHPSEILKVGDNVKVKVLSFDKDNEKISLGMKQLTNNPWENLKNIEVGSLVKGTVSSITDYGLFVEIEKGVEGLIHISEISWTDRINDLNKFYNVGDAIEAVVISFDKDNRRMSLSIKQRDKNPWEAVTEGFKVGSTVTGTVSNVTDFGVFVNLKPGIDGLIHVSDLSWTEHIDHPSSLYKRDQPVSAMILSVDSASKKISLGIKQLSKDPWDTIEEQYKIGEVVEGEVSKITNFGMFVKLGSGIEGLVHISELNAEKKGDERVEDLFKIGQKYSFRVIKVSKEERKLGLSPRLTGEIREERREDKRHYDDDHNSGERRRHYDDKPRRYDDNNGGGRRHYNKDESRSGSKDRDYSYSDHSLPKQKTQLQLELERHTAARKAKSEDE